MALSAWHLWVIAAIVLFIAEVMIPGFLVACFGMGCLASAAAAALGLGPKWQLLAFTVGTLVVYVGIRPLFLRHLYGRASPVKTNVDALVGRVGVVTETLDPVTHQGRVKVGGEDWRGVPADDVAIEPGQRVEVLRVDGTKLIVTPVPPREEE